MSQMAACHRFPLLLAIFLAALAWSGWQPRDRFIRGLEVAPAVGGVALLGAMCAQLSLSRLHDRQLRIRFPSSDSRLPSTVLRQDL